jgi:hypothetical protein
MIPELTIDPTERQKNGISKKRRGDIRAQEKRQRVADLRSRMEWIESEMRKDTEKREKTCINLDEKDVRRYKKIIEMAEQQYIK